MKLDNLRNTLITLDLEIADTEANLSLKTAKLHLFSKGLRSVYGGKTMEIKASKELWEIYLKNLLDIKKRVIECIEEVLNKYGISEREVFKKYVYENKDIKQIALDMKLTIKEVEIKLGNLRKELERGN